MEEEKILENITKNISSRLKVPIIATYLSVLIIYNWDILFYLAFETNTATNKINFIKTTYGNLYYTRIYHCFLISIGLILIFTVINTFLNFCLKWFYKKDKEITSEVESYEKINVLSEQLSQSLSEIKNLKTQLENLQNINESLLSRDLNIDISKISEKDYNDFISFIVSQPNSEKLKFSLNELITFLKSNSKMETDDIYRKATYEADMKSLTDHLVKRNLLKLSEREYSQTKRGYVNNFEISKSFKDFLTMSK